MAEGARGAATHARGTTVAHHVAFGKQLYHVVCGVALNQTQITHAYWAAVFNTACETRVHIMSEHARISTFVWLVGHDLTGLFFKPELVLEKV